ncbi:ATP-dependent DNA ligase [Haloquadratum walsbyi]|uniref:ATP dependent DNA ligase domain protein n=1 Tax=Haloquadratum walsbyi J07HQW2 TaxID=1238425 RepID=U1NBS6_9EURY|nr:ATP-dependent DNA ligase [Haloquadratum walsbyi]ERG94118.1 MAG: ATP dependent DNA ligase domain protein [Haloquadratum walsbyi J07HQW2]
MSPVVGDPLLPMLAKSEDVIKDIPAEWIAQPKYDGALILVHIKNGEMIEAFSRNANTVGDSLPELTRLVDDVALLSEKGEFILNGEAIPFKDGKRRSFRAIDNTVWS